MSVTQWAGSITLGLLVLAGIIASLPSKAQDIVVTVLLWSVVGGFLAGLVMMALGVFG